MSGKKKTKETTNVFSIPVFGAEKVGKSAVSLRYAKDQFKSLISNSKKKKNSEQTFQCQLSKKNVKKKK